MPKIVFLAFSSLACLSATAEAHNRKCLLWPDVLSSKQTVTKGNMAYKDAAVVWFWLGRDGYKQEPNLFHFHAL